MLIFTSSFKIAPLLICKCCTEEDCRQNGQKTETKEFPEPLNGPIENRL